MLGIFPRSNYSTSQRFHALSLLSPSFQPSAFYEPGRKGSPEVANGNRVIPRPGQVTFNLPSGLFDWLEDLNLLVV